MTPTPTRFRAVLTTTSALALVLCTAACNSPPGQTMTEDQATEKVQEHIKGTLSALPEDAELEARNGPLTAACDDPTDGGPEDRVTVSERYWIRGIPSEDNEGNIDLMHEYWTGNGYQALKDERADSMTVEVEHEEDAFRMSIRVSNKGSLSLGASSPCISTDGE